MMAGEASRALYPVARVYELFPAFSIHSAVALTDSHRLQRKARTTGNAAPGMRPDSKIASWRRNSGRNSLQNTWHLTNEIILCLVSWKPDYGRAEGQIFWST
jgi:hypothetical protein